MNPEFAAIPFEDEPGAAEILARLLEPERPGLAEALADELGRVSDASAVLVRLERFLDRCVSRSAELATMASAPRYAHLLCVVFDESHYLTDILCRNPEYAQWLWQDATLHRARTADEIAGELRRQVEAFDAFDAQCRSLRRYKRREMLRIGARDVVEYAPVESVTEDLSHLAEAVLDTALACARRTLEPRFGAPQHDTPDGPAPTPFVVLAMGKLGGGELNFSSDIDLVFLYGEEGHTTGGRSGSVTNAEYFQKLGERLIKAVSAQTEEGRVFRVDMRLRPYGAQGPLCISLDGAIHYYETAGQAWERQALIKARPTAGDEALGEAFLARTRPFVFPRYFDDETLRDILDVKRQMEAQIAERGETDIDVKLGRGGIRDIEFAVQALQLLNAGRFPDLRTPNTLAAIGALGRLNHLRPFEATALASNYRFFRQVEHRLQIEGSQQRHVLPQDPASLGGLARRLGYESGPAFMNEFRRRTQETRAILEQFIDASGPGVVWLTDLLDPRSDGTAAAARLADYGFADAPKARQELLELGVGTRDHPYSAHVRHKFAEIAPRLIEALAAMPNPDAALLRLGRILAQVKAPSALYDILKWTPALCKHLAALAANSEYLSGILARDPGLFDMLGAARGMDAQTTRADLEQELEALGRAYEPEAAPYRLRDGELLRIGMRELFDNATVLEVGRELSRLAEVCLGYAVRAAEAKTASRYGACSGPFAVLALGKLGGREMGYGSDLDLVFVYSAAAAPEMGMAPAEYYAQLASRAVRLLKERTRHGVLYDIDARLRPDGGKGMLAISDARLEQYYRGEAQAWERLALVKVRAVAGDLEFGARVEALARDIAFEQTLSVEALDEIEGIRGKIAAKAEPLDLKKDEGGIAEIEFAVRLLQLRHVRACPELKRGDVLGAVDVLTRHGWLDAADFAALADTYLLFRKIENRIRMMHGQPGSSLPSSPDDQCDMAQRLGIHEDLAALVAARKAQAHAVYQRIFKELRQAAASA